MHIREISIVNGEITKFTGIDITYRYVLDDIKIIIKVENSRSRNSKYNRLFIDYVGKVNISIKTISSQSIISDEDAEQIIVFLTNYDIGYFTCFDYKRINEERMCISNYEYRAQVPSIEDILDNLNKVTRVENICINDCLLYESPNIFKLG